MSIHIGAPEGAVAETVLLPGDPLRARWIAETMLENVEQYNKVRGMLGFTGTYNGRRVSVQGTGMGIPSISIYATELVDFYGARRLIRIGSCGAIRDDIELRQVILAVGACTDSSMNRIRFRGMDFAPTAAFPLLLSAWDAAKRMGVPVHAGTLLSTDAFYQDEPDFWKIWADYGVLAVEMETAALYTIAAKHGAQALSVCTVSDNLVTGQAVSSEDRERTFGDMVRIALEIE